MPGGIRMRLRKDAKTIQQEIANQPPSPTDPNGSYTGLVKEPWEKPVQDADDL